MQLMRAAFIASPYYHSVAASLQFDESLTLQTALAARGVTLDIVNGLATDVDWGRYDVVLPLGLWGYHKDPAAFCTFITALEQRGVRLANAGKVLRWNLDKAYLLDLQRLGVTIAPLLHFPVGSRIDLGKELHDAGYTRYVLKPTISANALQTFVGEGPPSAPLQAEAEQILQHSGLLLQPFFDEILDTGELSLVFFGHKYSHTVVKVPKVGDFRSQPSHGAHVTALQPSAQVLAQAQAVVAAAVQHTGCPLVYARVDGFVRDGQLFLVELELIEPYLFLAEGGPASVQQLCGALSP